MQQVNLELALILFFLAVVIGYFAGALVTLSVVVWQERRDRKANGNKTWTEVFLEEMPFLDAESKQFVRDWFKLRGCEVRKK